MLKKTLKAITLGASVAVLAGCAGVVSPVGLGLYTSVEGPVAVTPNAPASKTGESCATNILGLIATGDASIEQARQNGGITNISTVDHNSTSILFLFSKFCTVVHGQ